MRTTLRLLIVVAALGGLGFVAFGGATGAEATPALQPPPDRELEEFVPTEQIPPGSEVSFPVDI